MNAKHLVFFFFSCVASLSYAEDWKSVYKSEAREEFVDMASIRKDGEYLLARQMANYLQPVFGKPGTSDITLSHYDCKKPGFSIIRGVEYPQLNGKGKGQVAYDSKQQPGIAQGFIRIEAPSSGYDALKVICDFANAQHLLD